MRHAAPSGRYQFPPSPPLSPLGCSAKNCYQLPSQPPPPSPPAVARITPTIPEARLGKILARRLRFDSILGTGAYGVVYSAVDIYDNTRYAVKTLSKFNADGSLLDQRQVMFQAREIRLHWDVSAHANVVRMLKIIEEADCIFVILEYCPEGDLFYNITECGQYVGDDARAKHVFLQLLDAVSFCHSRGIYHRDLKPENVLVTDQGNTVKLADFGLATSSETSEDYGCGSTFYMSPECLEHTSHRSSYYCAPNDVWSLGVILVNLTCGRNPWKQASFEDATYRAFTRNPDFLKTILPVSDELNDILGRIFTRDPAMRITMPELVEAIRTCPRFTCPVSSTRTTPPPPPYVPEPVLDNYVAPTVGLGAPGLFTPQSSSPGCCYSPSSSRSSSSSGSSDENDVSISRRCSGRLTPDSLDGMDFSDRPDFPMDDLVHCQASVPVQVPYPQARAVEFLPQIAQQPQLTSAQPINTRVPMPAMVLAPNCGGQPAFNLPNCWDTIKRVVPALGHCPAPFHTQFGFAVTGY